MKKILFLCSIVFLFILASCKKENPDLIVKDELNGDGTFQYDGRTYVYKRLMGEVAWMIENLAYLPSVSPSSTGSDSTPLYYVYGYEGSSVIAAKATENYKTYGVLYNLEAAKTACPPGWHLPSDEEWRWLFDIALGEPFHLEWVWGFYPGRVYLGKNLKSTTGWMENGNGDNSIGFTGLPAGSRWEDSGFEQLGYSGSFWTSTTDPLNWSWNFKLMYQYDGVYHVMEPGTEGYSVRCVEDHGAQRLAQSVKAQNAKQLDQ